MCQFPLDGPNVCQDHPNGPVNSQYNPDCFTVMSKDDIDGLGCSHGCVVCDDLPSQLRGNFVYFGRVHPSAPVTTPELIGPWNGDDAWGNPRWMRPAPDEATTADNKPGFLPANAPVLIKPGATFLLGCCHDTNGQECHGSHSTCDCWNQLNFTTDIGTTVCSNIGFSTPSVWNRMPGFWPDEVIYTGFTWPPENSVGGPNTFRGDGGIYCRRFTPWDNCSMPVRIWTVRPYTPKDLLTIFIRLGHRNANDSPNLSGCSPFSVVAADGASASGSPCFNSFGDPSNAGPGVTHNTFGGCAAVASTIKFRPKSTDKPRFGDEEYFPHENKNLNELRNLALDNIFFDDTGISFIEHPLPGNNPSMNFEFLDHKGHTNGTDSNLGLGEFSRTYDPLNSVLVEDPNDPTGPPITLSIEEEDLRSIFTFNACKTRYGVEQRLTFDWCPKYIEVTCYFVSIAMRKRFMGLRPDNLRYEIPHVSVEVRIEMHLRRMNPGPPGFVVRPYTDPPEQEEVVVSQNGIGTFPTVNPDGNRIAYRTATPGPNGPVIKEYSPPSVIQWRGSLSPLSVPSSYDFLGSWDAFEAGVTQKDKFKNRLTAANCEVGGYPSLRGTVKPTSSIPQPDAAKLWKGRYIVEFGGSGFDMCGP